MLLRPVRSSGRDASSRPDFDWLKGKSIRQISKAIGASLKSEDGRMQSARPVWPLIGYYFRQSFQFMLLSLPRHPRPSLCPSSSSALRHWWLTSAAQAFLPIIERIEVKGSESGLHKVILLLYWLTSMSFTRRWRGGAVLGDDWFWELSVKAGEGRDIKYIPRRRSGPRPSVRSFKEAVDCYKCSLMWACCGIPS